MDHTGCCSEPLRNNRSAPLSLALALALSLSSPVRSCVRPPVSASQQLYKPRILTILLLTADPNVIFSIFQFSQTVQGFYWHRKFTLNIRSYLQNRRVINMSHFFFYELFEVISPLLMWRWVKFMTLNIESHSKLNS